MTRVASRWRRPSRYDQPEARVRMTAFRLAIPARSRTSPGPAGSPAYKTGSTTGTTCGTVQAYNVTVRYAEGTVYGLTRINIYTQPGDSGGATFAGTQAQGITSGGTVGGCNQAGFQSFFQPVDEALSVYGLTLL